MTGGLPGGEKIRSWTSDKERQTASAKTISPQKSTQGLKEMSRVAYPYTGSGANYNSELINKGIFEVNKNQIGLNWNNIT